jgi:hypothetical protein
MLEGGQWLTILFTHGATPGARALASGGAATNATATSSTAVAGTTKKWRASRRRGRRTEAVAFSEVVLGMT